MTRTDFMESVAAVLTEELGDALTASELDNLQKSIVARVDMDWDPFEEEDPLDTEQELDADADRDHLASGGHHGLEDSYSVSDTIEEDDD